MTLIPKLATSYLFGALEEPAGFKMVIRSMVKLVNGGLISDTKGISVYLSSALYSEYSQKLVPQVETFHWLRGDHDVTDTCHAVTVGWWRAMVPAAHLGARNAVIVTLRFSSGKRMMGSCCDSHRIPSKKHLKHGRSMVVSQKMVGLLVNND